MSSAAPPILLDGRALAEHVRSKYEPEVASLVQAGRRPRLVVLRIGEDEAAHAYLRGQRRAAEKWGIDFSVVTLDAGTSERAALKALRGLNRDPDVTGILVALPLPAGLGARTLQHAIDPAKDVEGVHPENLGNCLYGRYDLLPCTALAVMALLETAEVALEGTEAVVVGHSEIVGKPTALLLLAQNATVSVCHKFTHDLAAKTRLADVLVVAVGKPGLITADMVKPGAVVVDVGINAVPDPDRPGRSRIVGDVDFEGVSKVARALTPVPGGVGPVTVAALMRNTVLAAKGTPPLDDPDQLPLFQY